MYHRAAPPITAVVVMGLAWILVLIFHQKVQFLGSSFLRGKMGLWKYHTCWLWLCDWGLCLDPVQHLDRLTDFYKIWYDDNMADV